MAAARVLVVDDDLMMLDVVSRSLKRTGYKVLPADGPRKAVEIVRNNSPVDLVISDIAMPEMEGTQLVREVVQISADTPVVLMTGGAVTEADIPVGVPVIRKPFSIRDDLDGGSDPGTLSRIKRHPPRRVRTLCSATTEKPSTLLGSGRSRSEIS
jgi:CheY-like chemotaxis protein